MIEISQGVNVPYVNKSVTGGAWTLTAEPGYVLLPVFGLIACVLLIVTCLGLYRIYSYDFNVQVVDGPVKTGETNPLVFTA